MRGLSINARVLFATLFVVSAGAALAYGGFGGGGFGGGGGRAIPADPWTPDSDIGRRHIDMTKPPFGAPCDGCHGSTDYTGPMAPPELTRFQYVNMGDGQPCSRCHDGNVFTAQMQQNDPNATRCGNCHVVARDGGGR